MGRDFPQREVVAELLSFNPRAHMGRDELRYFLQ